MNIQKQDDKESRIIIEYVHYMLDEAEYQIFEEIKQILENSFEPERLKNMRAFAERIIKLRDDMNERMRLFRSNNQQSNQQ